MGNANWLSAGWLFPPYNFMEIKIDAKYNSDLLAKVAEESYYRVKMSGGGISSEVAVIDGRICAVEMLKDSTAIHLMALIRHNMKGEAEKKLCNAALEESGLFQYSTIEIDRFTLAQISLYTANDMRDIESAVYEMVDVLDRVLTI